MPIIKVNGIDLYYEEHGEGTPLVMIAGLASDSQSWQPILKEVSHQYRVIIFDNRGTGRTAEQNNKISIQDISDDCISLIKYLGLSSVHILGHSMGGFVAMDCAIRYPRYICKMILVGTSALNSERNNTLFLDWVSTKGGKISSELWFRNIFYWIFTKQFFEDKEVLDNALKFVIEYPYAQTEIAFKNQVDAIKEFNCIHELTHITSETLVIFGKEDLLFPPEESRKILQSIPKVSFSIVLGAAHSIHTEQPKEFVNIVQVFLAGAK